MRIYIIFLYCLGASFYVYGQINNDPVREAFDVNYYLMTNPDVAAAQVDPFNHFMSYGWKEGRNPNEDFDTNTYLSVRPDVAQANVNPFRHYILYGQYENTVLLTALNIDQALKQCILQQAEIHRWLFSDQVIKLECQRQGIKSLMGMEIFTGLTSYDFSKNLILDFSPLKQIGLTVPEDPVRYAFDEKYYLMSYEDIAKANIDPYQHYMKHGWKERRNPSFFLDVEAYYSLRPDVEGANLNPFVQFLRYGKNEMVDIAAVQTNNISINTLNLDSDITEITTVKYVVSDQGFNEKFAENLQEIGEISLNQFNQAYSLPEMTYLPELSWDPSQALFWPDFQKTYDEYRKGSSDYIFPKRYDFVMSVAEQDKFQRNGFVVSEEMAGSSFAEIYYRLFHNDLPVFITTDSILHAWHRSYDTIFAELESSYLIFKLRRILTNIASHLPMVYNDYQHTILEKTILDMDIYIAVARSLLEGEAISPRIANIEQVNKIIKIIAEKQLASLPIFDDIESRLINFSRFVPNGHYLQSEDLSNYFLSRSWLALVDFRILENEEELKAALILNQLLKDSGSSEDWHAMNQLIESLVGRLDSMSLAQFDTLLQILSYQSLDNVKNVEDFQRLKNQLQKIELDINQIAQFRLSPHQELIIPTTVSFLGKRFTIDSWALYRSANENIQWQGNIINRRKTSALDMAFSVLKNDFTVPYISDRINDKEGLSYRDGLPYQHHLAAVRETVDQLHKSYWQQDTYSQWLYTLQALSAPTMDDRFPDAMRTRAWAAKTLNTQLASWTQLRHDNALEVAIPETTVGLCYYPAGFVEPRLVFWRRMKELVRSTRDRIMNIDFPDEEVTYLRQEYDKHGYIRPQLVNKTESLRTVQNRILLFLADFADQVGKLETIADKQFNEQELSAEETAVFDNVIEIVASYWGFTQFNGWYPQLFYKSQYDSDTPDGITAQVFINNMNTDGIVDVGGILHQSVGKVNMMLIVVDNGGDKMMYGGPVFSHYEYETANNQWIIDDEWKDMIRRNQLPEHPEWTESFLVPYRNWCCYD